MIFSSITFLFLFLPVVLVVYYLIPRVLRNVWLLITSLIFYAWGEPVWVFLMIGSILGNYIFGRLVHHYLDRPRAARGVIALAVVFNLGLLAWFKYANFFVVNLNSALVGLHRDPIKLAHVALPVGISFFTFHCISYIVDIYRGEAAVQKNPFNMGLYITLFSQLIAGPILRFGDVAHQFEERHTTLAQFSYGVRRFIYGLGKKVLIANAVAGPADHIFAIPSGQLTAGLSWMGALCYTLQIYFDFSGYSDMAIGLGHMFGFSFKENFNYPYISGSITEFWRRWHMSLSSWFRDYLYIPLGGNRKGALRTYVNLFLVFFLCGLWHGASWTFVIWGMFHGLLLVTERLGLVKKITAGPLRHVYVMLLVIIGWVFFRAETFPQALAFLRAMAGFGGGDGRAYYPALYMNNELLIVFVIGCLFSIPLVPALAAWRERWSAAARGLRPAVLDGAMSLALYALLIFILYFAAANLSASTYNPFIYYRF